MIKVVKVIKYGVEHWLVIDGTASEITKFMSREKAVSYVQTKHPHIRAKHIDTTGVFK